MERTPRLRFAPSPTGHLHIGNARTAILNWIFAKQSNGKFILRIEDTDVERSTEASEQSIFEDLKWLGLDWDEGPIVDGEYGPYRQSERLPIYREYLNTLKRKEKVYPCFCTEEEIANKRQAALDRGENPRYDRKCLELSKKEKQALKQSGRKPVWRFLVQPGEIKLTDLVKGPLSFEGENFGDFIIVRADGIPTYNFAAAVDDATMEITHVIRGDDHVSNTPKQILIYQTLSYPIPRFCHIPMILGPDRTRLSKRHGATSINDFKSKGYLPEALINYLSLLSWSSESGNEILSLEKLIEEFDFNRMSKSPAIFDRVKLNWMNGIYIRNLDIDKLVNITRPFLQRTEFDLRDNNKLKQILLIIRDGIENLSQISDAVEPFFREKVQIRDGKAIALSSKDTSQKIYWAFLRYLQKYGELNEDTFRSIMKQVQKETGIMGKDLWVPIRIALTGEMHGPELPKVAAIL
ncbi:MAG: glutamate--tRNA ligase, partial [bacterium]